LHTIEKLHYITDKTLVIQTRVPDNQILQHILSGNVLPLYREDLTERKRFGYPPFKRLIKVSFTGTASETEKSRNYIDHAFEEYEPQVFSAFKTKVKGTYITNTVLKVNPDIWPLPFKESLVGNPLLKETLKGLPPSFAINVDPEDLL
jgi:primosomal protein N'